MFGLGKTERAEKALRSSLGIFIPGDNATRNKITTWSPDETRAAVAHIVAGEDAYHAGAVLIAKYVQATLASQESSTRQRLLRIISANEVDEPPKMFRFAIHMVRTIAVLETGKKPIVPEGTTHDFLNVVAEAFSSQEQAKNRIASYLYQCAAKSPNGGEG